MKRPIAIYFVGFWCFLGMAMQVSGFKVLAENFFKTGDNRSSAASFLSLINILVIWHVARLIQLKRFNIWLSVYFFGVWTLMLCINSVLLLMRDTQFSNLVGLLRKSGH